MSASCLHRVLHEAAFPLLVARFQVQGKGRRVCLADSTKVHHAFNVGQARLARGSFLAPSLDAALISSSSQVRILPLDLTLLPFTLFSPHLIFFRDLRQRLISRRQALAEPGSKRSIHLFLLILLSPLDSDSTATSTTPSLVQRRCFPTLRSSSLPWSSLPSAPSLSPLRWSAMMSPRPLKPAMNGSPPLAPWPAST